MKIVCLSDTHTKHKQVPIPDGDILIHAGDMTGLGKFNEFISIGNWFKEMKERFKYRIMIAGNHDWGLYRDKNLILQSHFDKDLIYLQDSGIEIEGIKFYGTPWMPQFYNWAFMKEEEELPRYYDAIPDDTEILITHCPPFSILDRNSQEEEGEGEGEGEGERCGSTSLLSRVLQLSKLKHHIFGHIHDHGGKSEVVNGISFHNACSLNYKYRYQNPPIVIEI